MRTLFTLAALIAASCLAPSAEAFGGHVAVRQRVVVQRQVVRQQVVVQKVVAASVYAQAIYAQPVFQAVHVQPIMQAYVAPQAVVQQQVHGCAQFFRAY